VRSPPNPPERTAHPTGEIVGQAGDGVGSIAVQLARRAGATVLGIAGPASAGWLRSVGGTPVTYGEGLADRLKAAGPDGISAFIDCFGSGYVDLAVQLGVPTDRIDTIIDWAAAQKAGVMVAGLATVEDPAGVLSELAGLVAEGELVVPIAKTCPLDQARDAFAGLEQRHTLGKIVLLP
jgi:NADPH:quinone reductase-like Zn-dependent oxidoreductase